MKADIVIVGGGASGLIAAIEAKKLCPSAKVVIAERLDRIGRKILATGNGRCNLSNMLLNGKHYHGSVNAMDIIGKTPSAADYFEEFGVLCVSDSEGRVYPHSNSAATVLNALRLRTAALDINELCGFELKSYDKNKNGYILRSAAGDELSCKRVIIAAGGYAAPSFGTDGGVLRMLKEKGYKLAKICPAVAPLRVRQETMKGLKGIRVKGRISAVCGERILKEEMGEIQFTENSVSGICVFNLAYLFQNYEGRLALHADIAPDMDEKRIMEYLSMIRKSRAESALEELLTGMFVKNLAVYITKRVLKRPLTDKISTVSDSEIKALARKVKCLEFEISGCSSWQNAQSTCGGIHADCVDERLESRLEKGVYLCGEILDTDGDCGGFNLQWAWSSGMWAGRSCAASLKGERV